jgi:hypothetical protein
MLFVSQRVDRINRCCAPRGQPGGKYDHATDHNESDGVGQRIVGFQAEKLLPIAGRERSRG